MFAPRALVGLTLIAMFTTATLAWAQPFSREVSDTGIEQDAGAIFDYYAQGRSYFMINETRTLPVLHVPLLQYAYHKGITSGQITRQEFIEFSKQLRAISGAGGNDLGSDRPLERAPPSSKSSSPAPETSPYPSQNPEILRWADNDFKRRDVNGDDKLSPEEMPAVLRRQLAKWDVDKDGLIDPQEYRAYFRSRVDPVEPRKQDEKDGKAPDEAKPMAPAAPKVIVEEEDEDWDRRPNVFRAGKLPTDSLPDWFAELDTDNDGQVALYEWRMAGKSLKEFQTWDANDDGFITPEEAVKRHTLITNAVHDVPDAGLVLKGEMTDKPFIFYHVKLTKGKTYVIDMIRVQNGGLDPFLRLLNSEGRQLAQDDDSGGDLNARIIFVPKATAVFHIMATRLGNGRGPFTLKVRLRGTVNAAGEPPQGPGGSNPDGGSGRILNPGNFGRGGVFGGNPSRKLIGKDKEK